MQVTGNLIISDPLLVAEAAADGSGLVYGTEDLVRKRVETGRLEIVLMDYSLTSGGYYLYYAQR